MVVGCEVGANLAAGDFSIRSLFDALGDGVNVAGRPLGSSGYR